LLVDGLLIRPRDDRVIAGVCAGLARRFGWNVTVVRVLATLSVVLPGSAAPTGSTGPDLFSAAAQESSRSSTYRDSREVE
jgi:xanthine dehydrogenase molybdopterin-binding subunit B